MKLSEAQHNTLHAAKLAHIRKLASAGHTPLTQGYSFECAKCGLSGTLALNQQNEPELYGEFSTAGKRCARE